MLSYYAAWDDISETIALSNVSAHVEVEVLVANCLQHADCWIRFIRTKI